MSVPTRTRHRLLALLLLASLAAPATARAYRTRPRDPGPATAPRVKNPSAGSRGTVALPRGVRLHRGPRGTVAVQKLSARGRPRARALGALRALGGRLYRCFTRSGKAPGLARSITARISVPPRGRAVIHVKRSSGDQLLDRCLRRTLARGQFRIHRLLAVWRLELAFRPTVKVSGVITRLPRKGSGVSLRRILGGTSARRPGTVTTNPRSSRVAVFGSLTGREIQAVVRNGLPAIRRCTQSVLRRGQPLAGKVVVRFVVNPRGAVRSARPQRSTLGNRAVERCIVAAVRRWRFPRPRGGGIVIVTYPFVLRAAP